MEVLLVCVNDTLLHITSLEITTVHRILNCRGKYPTQLCQMPKKAVPR